VSTRRWRGRVGVVRSLVNRSMPTNHGVLTKHQMTPVKTALLQSKQLMRVCCKERAKEGEKN
jgi:hypothetical protein